MRDRPRPDESPFSKGEGRGPGNWPLEAAGASSSPRARPSVTDAVARAPQGALVADYPPRLRGALAPRMSRGDRMSITRPHRGAGPEKHAHDPCPSSRKPSAARLSGTHDHPTPVFMDSGLGLRPPRNDGLGACGETVALFAIPPWQPSLAEPSRRPSRPSAKRSPLRGSRRLALMASAARQTRCQEAMARCGCFACASGLLPVIPEAERSEGCPGPMTTTVDVHGFRAPAGPAPE
jgi:hypothetical protein